VVGHARLGRQRSRRHEELASAPPGPAEPGHSFRGACPFVRPPARRAHPTEPQSSPPIQNVEYTAQSVGIKSRSTRIRRPFPSSMTIKRVPFEALIEVALCVRSGLAELSPAGATISTGTKADPSSPSRPSRASRRQVNSWQPESPCRRAVAETSPHPPKLSATIRRFSSKLQRRRAPVEMTSMRDTFDIVV
jgi:hypothetical protein